MAAGGKQLTGGAEDRKVRKTRRLLCSPGEVFHPVTLLKPSNRDCWASCERQERWNFSVGPRVQEGELPSIGWQRLVEPERDDLEGTAGARARRDRADRLEG